MNEQDRVEQLYKLFGFEVLSRKKEAIAFMQKETYFMNVEIVQFSKVSDNALSLENECKELGYFTRILVFESYEKIHDILFNGLFKVSSSNRRLLEEYGNFCKLQAKTLSDYSYEYIESSYLVNNEDGSNKLISEIATSLTESSESSRLIILEAAAGYGKTCTSFEVAVAIVKNSPEKVPLLAELSKNRTASIFSYVLLAEIDKHFSHLSSELVMNEIKEGRVPLIIDGFDELLSKKNDKNVDEGMSNDQVAKTMLDTIADLLKDNSRARILLTTRRSSFMAGDIFDSFVEQLDNCEASRIQLLPPKISQWIEHEKVELLRKRDISLEHISSPVLLTMLRHEPLSENGWNYSNIDDILDKYLTLLLEREMKRQSLSINVAEQLSIMERLASFMVEWDTSAEEIEFIKEILQTIITSQEMKKYIDRYISVAAVDGQISLVTSEDTLLGALSHHALLDRVSYNENRVGFINDFFYGVMISNAIINGFLSTNEVKGKYLDISLSTSANRSSLHKEKLYAFYQPITDTLPPEQQLLVDISLTGTLTRNYDGQFWDGIKFDNGFRVNNGFRFSNCNFLNCIFRNVSINTDCFYNCYFHNCNFYELDVTDGEVSNCGLVFTGCVGYEEFEKKAQRQENEETFDENRYLRMVLEQYWKVGSATFESKKAPRTLFRGIAQNDKKYVSKAINQLIREGVLNELKFVLELNYEKMSRIREITER